MIEALPVSQYPIPPVNSSGPVDPARRLDLKRRGILCRLNSIRRHKTRQRRRETPGKRHERPSLKNLNIVIITGLSGSGKSTALDALEDTGYFCVDNMPVMLLPKFLEIRSASVSEVQKLAFGMDLREPGFIRQYGEIFGRLREQGHRLQVVFLEAAEEVLLKRFSQTRRQHPLTTGASLPESIRAEKAQLEELKKTADRIIDTSRMTAPQLKEVIFQYAYAGVKTDRMRVGIVSFGFKYGVPLESDVVMDVRFIPNPYFVPELKGLDGRDRRVRRFVNQWSETREFLRKYHDLLDYLLPLYEREGKSYLTIAAGCTGGRHRSVTVAEELFRHFRETGREVTLIHRDIDR